MLLNAATVLGEQTDVFVEDGAELGDIGVAFGQRLVDSVAANDDRAIERGLDDAVLGRTRHLELVDERVQVLDDVRLFLQGLDL